MHRSWVSSASAALLACAAFLLAVPSDAGQYEGAPTFSAGQVLQGIPLRGADYSIGNSVPVENFQYVFSVNTKWGPFRVKGSDLLRVRLREIAATAKLEEVNGAETAVESAGKTALRPLNTAKDLVTNPGQTIGDTFRGVGRVFGSADAAMNATDPHGDSIVASVTGGASARRKAAFNLGVDPNTTFSPLADQLKRVATASAVGETSANVGMSFVAGPAGFAIGATGTSSQLRDLLRDKSPADLEKDGRKSLTAIGISQGTINAFYANPNLTPTDKAVIVTVMENLGNAQGRELFIAGAANASSIEMGFFYRHQAMLIQQYSRKISPVRGFVSVGGAPMLATANGTVSILPVDYLTWSAPLAGLVGGSRSGELWITGTASPGATAQLAALGWKVVPRAGTRLGTYPQLAGWN
ncbi:hypothetical protein [Methyloceanibacter sp.]|uniref:hypothetical protein n=1 Tax=Methyloceanibacter sp. TaxID=1965321 RepID=UPI002D53502B|nr:hypothetical protein [Methyloceanibacter sp.]HZP10580.1 hypothetical protein [Methyloceanibacter sp.]